MKQLGIGHFWRFLQCILVTSALYSTMCNSSFIINSSELIVNESLSWFCMCKDHFGIIMIVCTLTLGFLLGAPFHCWTFWVFLRGHIKPNMVFPLNMTLLELLFCIEGVLDLIDLIFSTTVSYNLTTFLVGVVWTFRPLVQICMCIEQYLAVIYPVTFLRYKGIQYRVALVTVAWLIALGNGIRLASIRLNYFRDHVYFFLFCIGVITTSFCCASVLHTLKRPGPGDRNNVEMTDRGRTVANQQKRKAFRIISSILISILVCYLPIVVVYFMWIVGVSDLSILCDAVPLILSLSIINVLISSPLIRMYSEGHLKHIMCFSKLQEQIK